MSVQAITSSRIEWADTDAGGHHHNSVIFRLVEAAEAELVRQLGLNGYFPAVPRVRHEADFRAPLWFGQEVTTRLWVEKVGTSSLTYAFEVWGEAFEERDRLCAASGRVIVVHAPVRAQGSSPWPEAWRQALTDISHTSNDRHYVDSLGSDESR